MNRLIGMLLLVGVAMHAQADEVAGIMFTPATTNAPRVVLPLEKTDVRIDVTAGIARTEVVQRFRNPIDRPLEAVYIFPLPSEAAIEDFELRLKGRVIRSTVKERKEAKAAYEKAKTEGKKAALLEQERPNIFTTSVANLLPGETVEICFTYVEALRFSRDRYDLTFPMVVGERYIPFKFDANGCPQASVPDAARLNPPVLHPALDSGHRLSIEVKLSGLPVGKVESNTHAIDVREVGADRYRVSLKNKETVPNCEFNLGIVLRESDAPAVTLVRSVGDEAYGLLSVFPPIGDSLKVKPLPKDVVFLVDTSGSMGGESMAQAKTGLKRCLGILEPEDRFSIVRFASEYSWFSPELRPASPGKLSEAEAYIDGLDANGGTEMQPALKHVFSMLSPEEGRMPLVVFLTDGDVGNEAELIRLLASRLGNTRLFCFGIGSAPNEFLMHRMAEAGRGQTRFIRSHEDIGEVMADFFTTLRSPVLTDVSVEWEGADVDVFPARCPDIFYGRPLRLVARAADGFDGRIVVSGMLNGEPKGYSLYLPPGDGVRHPSIEKLYGRMQVKDLMVQLMQAKDPAAAEKLKEEITDVGLRHQLVTQYTSRVAIEERVVVEDGDLVSVKVPVPAPKGWTMYKTASNETLNLLVGMGLLAGAVACRSFLRAA